MFFSPSSPKRNLFKLGKTNRRKSDAKMFRKKMPMIHDVLLRYFFFFFGLVVSLFFLFFFP